MNWNRHHYCIPKSAVVAAMLVLGLVGSLSALDPERPLTQALLRIWQSNQGLPRAAIFSIRQTRDGYLWLGTQTGVYRFDGVRFVPVLGHGNEPLANRWVQELSEDRSGNLWIAAADAGLMRLRDGATTAFGLDEGLPSMHVRCLLIDRQGDLWAGTDRGLAHVHDDKVIVYRTEDGLPANEISALCESSEGDIWIGTDTAELCTWNRSRFKKEEFAQLPGQAKLSAIQCTPDGTIWIGTTGGLLRRRGAEERLFTTADGLASNVIQCLCPARNGNVWVGTKDGLCRIQGDHIESFQTKEGLSQSSVMAICEDHEGSLWIGTKHGLNQLVDRRTLLPFTTSEGLPSNDTGPVLQDSSGNVWVGTLGAGLAQFDGRRFTQVATTTEGLPSNTILSLADGGDGQLWIGTDQGLCNLQNGKVEERFTTAEGLPANRILSLCRDRMGQLWIGTENGLVERREGRFVSPVGAPSNLQSPFPALIDYHGQYLVAATTDGNLYRAQNGQLQPLSDRLADWKDIQALGLDDETRLWVALRGSGLGLVDGDKHFRFGIKDGLYDDDIFGIAADAHGRLWMACSRGIFFVPLTDLERFAAGKIPHLTSTPFSPTDALRTIECQNGVQPAVWKMQDGRLWFSTIRGIIVVDPQRFSRQLPKPTVVIEEVRVNGEEIRPQNLKQLPPGRTNFEFHYTALSFASPSRITFHYQLDGFDRDWIVAAQRREAFYTNLAPGTYRFRVRAINSDGVETEAAQPIKFTLRPHFHQTYSFLFLILATLIGVGWFAYRFRVRQMKDRLQVVLAERNRIARELHDTLIQGFSGVTMQMQALATRLHKHPESATLTEIIRDAGGCLSEARRSVAGLRNPQGNESGLATAITTAARQLTEATDIRLQLNLCPLPAKLNADLEYNLLRIVQEAIANAVKHAGAGAIEVAMSFGDQGLTISVRDDGSGFDVSRHLEHAQPGHYGIIGMRERASQISAQLHWRSQLRQGTTVSLTLRLPVSVGTTSERRMS